MGSAMAANTVRAGYTVIGYDVDAARVRDHVRAGGIAARSSADVRKTLRRRDLFAAVGRGAGAGRGGARRI